MSVEKDHEITQLLVTGKKQEAFSLLLKEYKQPVYWLVRKMVIIHEDTDDVVQEVFLKIWINLKKFRGDSKLYTWIYRIAVNETLNFLNKKNKRFFVPIDDYREYQSKIIDNDAFYTDDMIEKRLQKALLTLPPKQKLIFELRYFKNMKYTEIIELLGGSMGSLKASYHHAVKKIQKHLKLEINWDDDE